MSLQDTIKNLMTVIKTKMKALDGSWITTGTVNPSRLPTHEAGSGINITTTTTSPYKITVSNTGVTSVVKGEEEGTIEVVTNGSTTVIPVGVGKGGSEDYLNMAAFGDLTTRTSSEPTYGVTPVTPWTSSPYIMKDVGDKVTRATSDPTYGL